MEQLLNDQSAKSTPSLSADTLGLRKGLTIAGLYLIAAELGHWLSFHENFATFWPPAGICVVALTVHHWRQWWRILAVIVLANLISNLGIHQRSLGFSVGFCFANVIEGLLAAGMLHLWMIRVGVGWKTDGSFMENISRAILGDWRSVLVFAIGGCLVSTVAGATIGASLVGSVSGVSWMEAFRIWWSGDAAGMLVVGAFGFGIIANWPLNKHAVRASWTVWLTLLALVGLSILQFGFLKWPMAYFVMPFFVLLIFRAKHLASTLGLFLLATIAAYFTSRGQGLFSLPDDLVSRAILLQAYLGVVGITVLLFEAILREKNDRDEQKRFELRTIFDSLDALVFMKDTQNNILRCNEAAALSLGRTPEQVAGRHASELYPESYRDFEAVERKILETGIANRNYLERLILPDGSVMFVDVSKIPYRDRFGNVEGLITIVNDVTKLTQAEQELSGLGRLIEDSTNEVFIFDADSLLFIRANRRAIANLGYTAAELYTMTPLDIKPEHTRESFLALVEPLVRGEKDFLSFETVHQRKDGSCYPVEIKLQRMDDLGKEVFVAFVFDITDRKRSEEMVEKLFKHSPVPLLLYADQGVIECNDAAVTMLGVQDKSEILFRQPYDFSPEYQPSGVPSRELAQSLIEVAFREGRHRFEWTHLRPDGSTFFTDVTLQGVNLESGRAFLVSWNDITEKKKYETALVSANRRLESSNAELAQFAYIASHDLKAPLRAISSLARFVDEDCGEILPTQSQEHLKMMQGRIVRMGKLLDDLLAFSRVGRSHGAMAETDTRSILQRAIDFSAVEQTIQVNIEGDAIRLTTLETPLQTCLRNLISNASKHRDSLTGTINLSSHDGGDHIRFEVADDGSGIPEEHQARVFRMFETLRPRDEVEGSGMGLAFVKKTIETYGGSISIDSPNTLGGTTFHLLWPKQISI